MHRVEVPVWYVDGDNTVPSHCLVMNGSITGNYLRDNAVKLGIDPFKLPPKETFCYIAVTKRLAEACLAAQGPREFSLEWLKSAQDKEGPA